MELTLIIVLGIFIGAIICEFIDSSMGMMYGTILSPVLIIAGFNPLLVVPSILLSQAMGGFTASLIHHRLKNAEFKLKVGSPQVVFANFREFGFMETLRKDTSRDLRATLCIAVLGVVATIFSVFVAINIPKIALKTYIGILVLVMGVILLSRFRFRYTWKKIFGVGLLSAFNKGLTGGGFGPVTTAGQIMAGRGGKGSIGATTLAEAPICIAGFLTYFWTKGIINWDLPIILIIGAIIGAIVGPYFTAKFKDDKKLRKALGVLVVVLGIWTLIQTWFL